MRRFSRFFSFAAVCTAALLAACGGGGSDSGSSGGGGSGATGILKVGLTDAAACGYDEVNVTVGRVRVHQSATAGQSDSGWQELVVSPARQVDLLSLNNGVVDELGQVSVPTGRYNQLQLVLLVNGNSAPWVNAVTPTATGVEAPLATPAASQSGLRIPASIDIVENQIADYVIDFDACKSVVRLGATGPYNLKPVLSLVQRVNSAGMRVVGYVATALPADTTKVSVQSAGAEVKSTPPDSTGRFTLYPVPAGTYDLVVSAVGRVPAVVTGVVVTNTAETLVNATGDRIDPPASGTNRTIAGTVSTGTTPIDAMIEIIKKYTGGPNVVVATAPVNGTTGAFAYTVNSGAPVRAAFSPTTAPLVFSPDLSPPTGRYTVDAIAGGSRKSLDVDVTTGDATNLSFTFP